MHDPMTVAFEIRRPWPSKKDRTHYPSLVTIWHVDPETDGSDDSCGWSRPHLTDKDRKFIEEMVDWEERWPYYFAQEPTPGTAVALVFSLFHAFAWRLERRAMRANDLVTIFELAATEGDNVQRLFAPDPEGTTQERRRYDRRHTLSLMLRHYRRMRRPWYRHPRWHLYHWRLQWHFGQALHRYLFSRCCKCGRRFSWGYSPMSSSWDSKRARLFHGEEGVYHHECMSSSRVK
jgi:hypothetical protein